MLVLNKSLKQKKYSLEFYSSASFWLWHWTINLRAFRSNMQQKPSLSFSPFFFFHLFPSFFSFFSLKVPLVTLLSLFRSLPILFLSVRLSTFFTFWLSMFPLFLVFFLGLCLSFPAVSFSLFAFSFSFSNFNSLPRKSNHFSFIFSFNESKLFCTSFVFEHQEPNDDAGAHIQMEKSDFIFFFQTNNYHDFWQAVPPFAKQFTFHTHMLMGDYPWGALIRTNPNLSWIGLQEMFSIHWNWPLCDCLAL